MDLEIALRLEESGKAYYETLAAGCASAELGRLFSLLARSEQVHYDALRTLSIESLSVQPDNQLLEQARHLFQQLLEIRESQGPDALQADPQVFREAIRIEEEAVAYYLAAADREAAPPVRRLLLALAAEEKLHLNIIENVCEFVESPKYFMQWRAACDPRSR
jgi:rubrerythrin